MGKRLKIAIVTGASSGMGRDFVREINRRFSSIDEIWMLARRRERLESLAKEIKIPVRMIVTDLSESDATVEFEKQLAYVQPDVKILINCAGFGKYQDFSDIRKEENLGMIKVNCLALTDITYQVLPYMKKGSVIINLASIAGFMPQPKFTVYAATKAYVLSFTRALRNELKNKKIRITAVCPGPVRTEFFGLAENKAEIMWYKKMIMVESEDVVKQAFDDALANKEISIYGVPMKALCILEKILPHKFILCILNILNGKGKNEKK